MFQAVLGNKQIWFYLSYGNIVASALEITAANRCGLLSWWLYGTKQTKLDTGRKGCMQRLTCLVGFNNTIWAFACIAQYAVFSISPPSKRYRCGRDRTCMFQVSR